MAVTVGIRRFFREWVSDIRGRKEYRRFRERDDRRRRVRAQLLAVLALSLTVAYDVWLAGHLNLDAWWFSIPFLIAELIALAVFGCFFLVSWYPRYHRPVGLPVAAEHRVDIFVTACGEPPAMVATTLAAAMAIDYEPKTVYLLDDRSDPRLEAAAAKAGCRYIVRPTHEDAKAGNLNYALARTTGDLILTLDADQVPNREILKAVVGYFAYPTIGFVQTRQSFAVPRGDPFGNTDPIFYGLMQLGKDTYNAAFSCGSGVVYRRRALEDVGGFSAWNLVEDLHTSLRLHDRQWRSVYHNYPLSHGQAPRDIWAAYGQRKQWAADSLRIFFWDNPAWRRGLTTVQKVQYLHLGLVYLYAGFVMPFFFLVPVISLFTGVFVLSASVWTYALWRLPSFIVTAFAYRYQYQAAEERKSFAQASNEWLGYFPAFIAATAVAIWHRKRKPAYRVNLKTPRARSAFSGVVGTLPQWALILASLSAAVYGIVSRSGSTDLLVINVLWAMWTVEKLVWICRAPFASGRAAA